MKLTITNFAGEGVVTKTAKDVEQYLALYPDITILQSLPWLYGQGETASLVLSGTTTTLNNIDAKYLVAIIERIDFLRLLILGKEGRALNMQEKLSPILKPDSNEDITLQQLKVSNASTETVLFLREIANQDEHDLLHNALKSISAIPHRAFEGCSDLTELTIPESVTSIGASAFLNCSGLTELTIPESFNLKF